MTEGLFLLTTAAGLWAHPAASVVGRRTVGDSGCADPDARLLLVGAALAEFLSHREKGWLRRLPLVFLPVLGTLAYLWLNGLVTGDPFAFGPDAAALEPGLLLGLRYPLVCVAQCVEHPRFCHPLADLDSNPPSFSPLLYPAAPCAAAAEHAYALCFCLPDLGLLPVLAAQRRTLSVLRAAVFPLCRGLGRGKAGGLRLPNCRHGSSVFLTADSLSHWRANYVTMQKVRLLCRFSITMIPIIGCFLCRLC